MLFSSSINLMIYIYKKPRMQFHHDLHAGVFELFVNKPQQKEEKNY